MKRRHFLTSTVGAAAAIAAPTAAQAQTVVTIGVVDSPSGTYATAASHHRAGIQAAIDELRRTNPHVVYNPTFGDDRGTASAADTETRRLVNQENADVLLGGSVSGAALARSQAASALGIVNVELAAGPSSLTGAQANPVTFRFTPSWRMQANAVARYIAARHQRTFVIQTGDAFGTEGWDVLNALFAGSGAAVVGHDTARVDSKSGNLDLTSALSSAQQAHAEIIVFAVGSTILPDAVRSARSTLGTTTVLASLSEILPESIPAAYGVIVPIIWNAALPASHEIRRNLAAAVHAEPSAHHYLGYVAMMNLDTVLSAIRTTDAARLARGFDQSAPFNAGKANRSFWQRCDHQCAQDLYVGRWSSGSGSNPPRLEILATVDAASSDPCTSPEARRADAAIRSATITTRSGYTPKRL